MKRTASALALSLATHTAGILALAAGLPGTARDVLIVELDALVDTPPPSASPPAVAERPLPARPAAAAATASGALAASPARPLALPEPPRAAPEPVLPAPPWAAPAADASPASRVDPSPPPRVEAAPEPEVHIPIPSPVVEAGPLAAASAQSAAPIPAAPLTTSAPTRAGTETVAGEGAGGGPTSPEAGGTRIANVAPGATGAGGYSGYLALLRGRIQDALQYPIAARRRGLTGTVHVEIAVQPSGAIASVVVIGSSHHRLLDDAAVDAVRALGRVPFPPGVEPRALRARLPIVFELQ